MEFNFSKLRFLRRHGIPLVRGSAFALPFKDASFDCVISSQVIEHIPYDEVLFSEMRRVLRPGGMLIIGTPDYATVEWRIIEPTYGFLLPGGYADEHITHYTREKLSEILLRHRLRDRRSRLRGPQRTHHAMPQGRAPRAGAARRSGG
jgi:SAM-dependent methyltransferase